MTHHQGFRTYAEMGKELLRWGRRDCNPASLTTSEVQLCLLASIAEDMAVIADRIRRREADRKRHARRTAESALQQRAARLWQAYFPGWKNWRPEDRGLWRLRDSVGREVRLAADPERHPRARAVSRRLLRNLSRCSRPTIDDLMFLRGVGHTYARRILEATGDNPMAVPARKDPQ